MCDVRTHPWSIPSLPGQHPLASFQPLYLGQCSWGHHWVFWNSSSMATCGSSTETCHTPMGYQPGSALSGAMRKGRAWLSVGSCGAPESLNRSSMIYQVRQAIDYCTNIVLLLLSSQSHFGPALQSFCSRSNGFSEAMGIDSKVGECGYYTHETGNGYQIIW